MLPSFSNCSAQYLRARAPQPSASQAPPPWRCFWQPRSRTVRTTGRPGDSRADTSTRGPPRNETSAGCRRSRTGVKGTRSRGRPPASERRPAAHAGVRSWLAAYRYPSRSPWYRHRARRGMWLPPPPVSRGLYRRSENVECAAPTTPICSGGASDRSRINSPACGWSGSSVYIWLRTMKHLIRHPVSSERLRLLYGISEERALELDEAALKVLDLKANGQPAHSHKAVRRARKSAKVRGSKTRRATAA